MPHELFLTELERLFASLVSKQCFFVKLFLKSTYRAKSLEIFLSKRTKRIQPISQKAETQAENIHLCRTDTSPTQLRTNKQSKLQTTISELQNCSSSNQRTRKLPMSKRETLTNRTVSFELRKKW